MRGGVFARQYAVTRTVTSQCAAAVGAVPPLTMCRLIAQRTRSTVLSDLDENAGLNWRAAVRRKPITAGSAPAIRSWCTEPNPICGFRLQAEFEPRAVAVAPKKLSRRARRSGGMIIFLLISLPSCESPDAASHRLRPSLEPVPSGGRMELPLNVHTIRAPRPHLPA